MALCVCMTSLKTRIWGDCMTSETTRSGPSIHLVQILTCSPTQSTNPQAACSPHQPHFKGKMVMAMPKFKNKYLNKNLHLNLLI